MICDWIIFQCRNSSTT